MKNVYNSKKANTFNKRLLKALKEADRMLKNSEKYTWYDNMEDLINSLKN